MVLFTTKLAKVSHNLKGKMKLKRDKTDELDEIQKSIGFYINGFGGLPKEKGSVEVVAKYRKLIEAQLKKLDERMCKIMNDDHDMTMWAVRMEGCRKHMRTLTMNSAFTGRPEWDWSEVIGAMAYLEAISKAAEATLELNELKLEQAEPASP